MNVPLLHGVLVMLVIGAVDLSGPIPDDCTCTMSVAALSDGGGSPGLFVPNCGQCIGVFCEMVDVTKGVCTGDPVCSVKGTCKGKLKVSISSSSMSCCTPSLGGWKPSWGSGWFTAGSGTTKTFDQLSVKCGETPPPHTDFSITWRDSAGTEVTQNIISTITCGNCDGPPPPP